MGIIQIVAHSTTVAKIQKEAGNFIKGTFRDEVLKKWLEKKNPTASKLEDAINTFMLSCAGYCVATYVLGKKLCLTFDFLMTKNASHNVQKNVLSNLCSIFFHKFE